MKKNRGKGERKGQIEHRQQRRRGGNSSLPSFSNPKRCRLSNAVTAHVVGC